MSHPYDALDLADLERRRSAKWRKYGPGVLPAWIAEMDYPLADPIQGVLADMVAASDVGYAWFDGLAEAYTGFAAKRYGVSIDPAHVLGMQDVMRGVLVFLELFTEPGDGVVINPPVYPPFFSTITYSGRQVVEVALARDAATGRHALDLEALDRAFRAGARTWVLCSPHNPTGRVFSRTELEAAAEVADRHGVLVIADEIHAPLTLPGAQFVPWAALDAESARRSLTLVSATKAWNVPGLKCALAVAGSLEIWRSVETVPDEVPYGASLLGVAATEAAFRDGVDWLDDTVDYLAGVRDLLGDLLAARLPAVRWVPPEATYLAWLDCGGLGLGDDPAKVFLEEGGVALAHGPDFGTAGAGFARLTFATARHLVTEAVERMAAAMTSSGAPPRAGAAG